MDLSKLHIKNVYAELMLAYYQMSPEQHWMALMDVIRESVDLVKKIIAITHLHVSLPTTTIVM